MLMLALSTHSSVLLPRYFMPMIPGMILLAVGVVGIRLSRFSPALATVSLLVMIVAIDSSRPYFPRPAIWQAEQQLLFLQKLTISKLTGVADVHVLPILQHYIPRRLGFSPNLRAMVKPVKIDLPAGNEPFWIFGFGAGSGEIERELLQELSTVCRLPGDVFIVEKGAMPSLCKGLRWIASWRIRN